MNISASLDKLELKHPIISIGNFDGVHLGHQMLLAHMQNLAQQEHKASLVITFFPPARHFFQGGDFLSTPEEKLEQLTRFQPKAVVMIPFDKHYAQTPKTIFIEQLQALEPEIIIVGEDFRFGHKREGSLNDLSMLAKRLEVFNLKHLDGQPVSSSRIRDLLKSGDISEANALLGRSYSASGVVIEGDKRGRTIGFPTANLKTAAGKALPLGVFAVKVSSAAKHYLGMANVGPRPSFPDAPPSLEVYLFDFSGDLYGHTLTVSFEQFLRPQRKFASLDELKAQLEEDKRLARGWLEAISNSMK